MNQTMKMLPDFERPYERCSENGPGYLTDAELLAVLLRTGAKDKNAIELAREVLTKDSVHPGLKGLPYLTKEELTEIPGIGKVKAIQILCLVELAKRMSCENLSSDTYLTKPVKIAGYFREQLQYESQECVYAVYFDMRCRLIKSVQISKGTVNASLVSPREVMLEALKCRATHVVLVHNHPSGNPRPSLADREITDRIKEAGELIGIKLLDHIIVGLDGYYSFSERNDL